MEKYGKITFFGQGQPVHFFFNCLLVLLSPTVFPFFPHTLALFTRWLLDFWRIFPILKAYHCQLTQAIQASPAASVLFSYDYVKLTAKSSISNALNIVPSYTPIF